MIKMNIKLRNFRNKFGRVLSRAFRVIVSGFYWHYCKLNDHTSVPIPCSSMNNSVHSQFFVLVIMIFTPKIFCTVDYSIYLSTSFHFSLTTCNTVDVLKSLTNLSFAQNYIHYSLKNLKNQSAFFDHTYLQYKIKLTITMFINYHYSKKLIFRCQPYKKEQEVKSR